MYFGRFFILEGHFWWQKHHFKQIQTEDILKEVPKNVVFGAKNNALSLKMLPETNNAILSVNKSAALSANKMQQNGN